MEVILLTPIRLLGDALFSCLRNLDGVTIVAQVDRMSALRKVLGEHHADIVLIDITQGVELAEVRAIATDWNELTLIALGLDEQRQEVIRCGRAGFSGYVPREATIEALHLAMIDALSGRLACPCEISAGLMKALFRSTSEGRQVAGSSMLTDREGDVLRLIGDGFSNKEIARNLELSVATVKHHVHSIFSKLNFTRRAEAMRHVREEPWIAPARSRPPPRPSCDDASRNWAMDEPETFDVGANWKQHDGSSSSISESRPPASNRHR